MKWKVGFFIVSLFFTACSEQYNNDELAIFKYNESVSHSSSVRSGLSTNHQLNRGLENEVGTNYIIPTGGNLLADQLNQYQTSENKYENIGLSVTDYVHDMVGHQPT